jgi:hypothetical protein
VLLLFLSDFVLALGLLLLFLLLASFRLLLTQFSFEHGEGVQLIAEYHLLFVVVCTDGPSVDVVRLHNLSLKGKKE